MLKLDLFRMFRFLFFEQFNSKKIKINKNKNKKINENFKI
jgi:hypothetical protein